MEYSRGGHCGVQNGKIALELLNQKSFDLILMDVQMPEMDGFTATAAIREQEKTTQKHIPIVAMTAHAMTGDRDRCIQAGMDDYVMKPVQIKDLFAVIEGVLTRTRRSLQTVST
jgi:two-component system sensor histidine kinase/response regulator